MDNNLNNNSNNNLYDNVNNMNGSTYDNPGSDKTMQPKKKMCAAFSLVSGLLSHLLGIVFWFVSYITFMAVMADPSITQSTISLLGFIIIMLCISAIIVGIAAIILAFISRKQNNKMIGLGIAGMIFGIFSSVGYAILLVIVLIIFGR